MKKVVLGAILVLLIAIGGGVFFLLSNLDSLVKKALETYGSEAAQTTVAVQKVKIDLRDGSGNITGLSVANPSGFSAQHVFSLGEISTRVDLKSISKEMITIDEVRILAPQIFFEINQAGQINLEQLKRNLAAGGSGSTAASSSDTVDTRPSESSAAPKIQIRKLLFADGQIHAKVVPLNKDYKLKLPRIELSNLGGDNGADARQIATQLLKVLSDSALKQIKKQGIDQYRKQLEGEVSKQIDAQTQKLKEQVGKKVGEQVGESLKGLLNRK